jgi:integrase
MEIVTIGRPISYDLTIPELIAFSQKSERTTTSTYTSCARNLERFLNEKHLTLETLTPLSAKVFIQQMGKWSAETNSYEAMNTAALYKKYLLAFFASLGKTDFVKWIKSNLKEVKFVSHFKVDIPTEEILRLIDTAFNDKRKNARYKKQIAFGISIMAFDGLRPAESLGLYYSDIDWVNKQVNIVRHPNEKYHPKAVKVGDPTVPIPLNEFSFHLLRTFTSEENDSDVRIIPVSYTTYRKRFLRYVNEAEVEDREGNKLTPHKMRHVFGHLWRNRGGDLQILKEIMRHSDIRITMGYSAPSKGEVNEAFEATKAFSAKFFIA